MLLIRGMVGEATLTGTLYERGEDHPSMPGAPDEGAAYVFICDEFYQVDSGGFAQRIGDRTVRVAFEPPMPRGFDTKEQAIDGAREHIETQFSRLGVSTDDVDIEIVPEFED